MPKELIGLSDGVVNDLNDRVLSHEFPNEEEFPHMFGQEDRAVKRRGRGGT